jgi:hypothetical protein
MAQGLRPQGDFRLKLLAALSAVMLGDALVWAQAGPFAAVLFALPPLALITRPALRRDRRSWVWLVLAMIMALALIWQPGVIGWWLYWIYAGIGALMPLVGRSGDAWQWAQRLVVHGARAIVAPVLDCIRWSRVRARRKCPSLRDMAARLALPVLGSVVIVALFAVANPVIEAWLGHMFNTPWPAGLEIRAVVWLILFAMAWSVLRPRMPVRVHGTFDDRGARALPGVSVSSVFASLIAFNALFALQNAMDLAWLWGLVPLPHGMTLAAYAHRGAYPLIVTAILAAGFVLVALRPGSETAARGSIRRLVVLWIMQNLLLVASAALRTWDYIAAYSLTAWRIAALLWMTLVALGLVLVCWRMIRGNSASWLINANAAAALALLSVCCWVDLDEVAVRYNIAHARELGGDGPPLDICYLQRAGPSALLALADLERRRAPAPIHLWAQILLQDAQSAQAQLQIGGSWSLQGARRLSALPQTRPGLSFNGYPDCTIRDIHELRSMAGLETRPDPTQPSKPLTIPARP